MRSLRNLVYRTLRGSEGLFKTDMVYLTKGGFWFTFAQIIVSLSSFLLAIAFAHFLTKEAYGQYKYILSIAGLLGALTLTGLPSALMRAVASGYEGSLSYAFWKNIKWSALFFALSFGISIYYFVRGNSSLGMSMLMVGALWPFLHSSTLYNAYLVAKRDFRRNAIYFEILGNIFPAACLLLAMLLTGDPVWLVGVFLGSSTLAGLLLYRRVVAIYRPQGEVDKELLGYGKHLSIMNVLSGIAGHLDQILTFQFIGPAQLAIYNFAIAIPNQTKGPLKGLRNLIFPKFVERPDGEIEGGMSHKFFMHFLLGSIMAIVYIPLAPWIYELFFPQYLDSVFLSQIFALSFLSITFSPADVYLAAKKRVREQYILNITNSILQIVAVTVGIIVWGLMGLVIARMMLRFSAGILGFILYRYSVRKATSQ